MGPPERRQTQWSSAGVGMSQGWSILVELGAIIGLFAFVGYRLDRLFGTKPWLLAVLMVVGYAGGVYHVILWTRRREQAEETKPPRGE